MTNDMKRARVLLAKSSEELVYMWQELRYYSPEELAIIERIFVLALTHKLRRLIND